MMVITYYVNLLITIMLETIDTFPSEKCFKMKSSKLLM